MDWVIERLDGAAVTAAIPDLCAILIDCVDGGASVGFVAPLSTERAARFWEGVAEGVAHGERVLLVARDLGCAIRGTVQLLPAAQNGPYRAEVAKLLVDRGFRRAGAGERLMRDMEAVARELGRTVLVLDTATDAARRLYERLGWTHAGAIPRYALNPDGSPCDTHVYWKALA